MGGLSAGSLDRAVTLEQLTDGRGASGRPIQTWATLEDGVWCSKENAGGRERFTAGQLAAEIDTVWRMQYRPSMDPDLVDVPKKRRVVYNGRAYDIVKAEEIGRQDGILLSTIAGSRVD